MSRPRAVSPTRASSPVAHRRAGVLRAALIALVAAALVGCAPWTIRPIADANSAQAQASGIVPGKPGFSPKAYADSIWASQVLPTVSEKANDLATVLAALKADPNAARQKYGHHEGTRPYNFLVKTEAKVLAVDTTLRSGTLKLDLLPEDGAADATVQLGPVLKGTALRDALPFIQFNQFTNQLEYADVSNELNELVLKQVLGTIDPASLAGKTVVVEGAFTQGAGGVLIIPTKLQAK